MLETFNIDMRPTVLLVDGAHTLRRSQFQESLRGLSNSVGMPTGAIFGFFNSLRAAINSMSASSVVVTWEGGHSLRRKQVYEQYKYREREEEPKRDIHGYTDYEYYVHQLSWIKKILECLGVPQVQVEGKEGDDVLFQASRLLQGRKIIISEDRDFYALISDDVSIYRPIKKLYIDKGNFTEVSNYLTPLHYLYGKVLAGDPSDNIPSVAQGVGEKTILSVLNNIPDPKDLSPTLILQEAARIGGKRFMKLASVGEEPIIRNLDLIDISREKFDVFQLQSMSDGLSTQRYPNVALANKLFNILEFSPENTRGLISKLSMMSEYPLSTLIDKTYIKRSLLGETSIFEG